MITIGSLTVRYNRIARAWEVQGAKQTTAFQTGPVGRQQALKFAIGHAFPEVAQAVARLCAREESAAGRAWSAAQLLLAGHVLVPGVDAEPHHVARVVSQQESHVPRHYYIGYRGDRLTCTCPDHLGGGVVIRDHSFCKHILAYCLGRYLGWPLQPQLPPQPRGRREGGHPWRGRQTIRVNGRAGRQGASNDTTAATTPTYGNGQQVSETHLSAYDSFRSVTGTAPFNQEKLLSWYYGR
jgi:hypothetical protein